MTKPTEGQMACPDCKKSIPVYEGVRNWCDGCGWNMGGEPPQREESFLARQYDRLGRRYGNSLRHRLKELPPERLRPRWSSRMAVAATMASMVHLLSLALVAFGFVLIITGYPNFMKILLGIGACLFGWLMWPSPISRPQKDVIQRNAYPALFALVDEVTDALGGQRINHIVIDEAFNASYALAGWRRVPVLTIGLPLWITLRNKERVAVLAHEVAHGVQTARMSEPVAKTHLRNATQRGGACLSMPSGAAGCLRLKGVAAGRRVQIPIEIAATPSPTSRGFLLQRLADAGSVSVAVSVLTGVRNPS